jgi:TQXA domain-containing protein/LPXTG-motif cell wall-anchored protein
VRAGLVALGAAALLVATAAPVRAAAPDATVDTPANQFPVQVFLHDHTAANAVLLGLRDNEGSPVKAYSVQLHRDAAPDHTPMTLAPWSKLTGVDPAALAKINWVLHLSFPAMDLAQLSAAAKTPTALTEQDAVGATQVAIWHFSDGESLAEQGLSANLVALYHYLVDNATTVIPEPIAEQLSITPPASTSGPTSGRIGPFVVHVQTAGFIQLTIPRSSGASLEIGGPGNPTHGMIHNGTQLTVVVPPGTPPGLLTFTLTAFGSRVGQLLLAPTQVVGGQEVPLGPAMMVAKSEPRTATASASWTASTTTAATTAASAGTTALAAEPAAVIANTGTSTAGLLTVAGLLLATGGVLLVVGRRRRRV